MNEETLDRALLTVGEIERRAMAVAPGAWDKWPILDLRPPRNEYEEMAFHARGDILSLAAAVRPLMRLAWPYGADRKPWWLHDGGLGCWCFLCCNGVTDNIEAIVHRADCPAQAAEAAIRALARIQEATNGD